MAIKKTASASGKKNGNKSVSYREEDMYQGGSLPDDFDGTISEACVVGYNFPSKDGDSDNPATFVVRLKFTPAESANLDAEVVEHVTFAYEAHTLFASSPDGEEALDIADFDGSDPDSLRGNYIIPTTDKNALPLKSDWGFFLGHLGAAGVDYQTRLSDAEGDLSSLVGISGHFNRLAPPGQKIEGKVDRKGQPKRERKVLVLTEEKAVTASKNAKAAPGKKAKTGADEGALVECIKEALDAKKNKTLNLKQIAAYVISNYDGGNKKAAIQLAADSTWVGEQDAWTLDEEEGTVTLNDE